MLVVISNETEVENEMETILELFEVGLDRFHLRRSSLSLQEVEGFFKNLPSKYWSKISVHLADDKISVPNKAGVHLKSHYSGSIPVNQLVSRGVHSLEELDAVQNCSYVFLSPVFQSISKKGYGKNSTVKKELETTVGNWSFPIIALGGVSSQTIRELDRNKWGGVALKGAIWNCKSRKDRLATFNQVKEAWI